MKNSALIIGCGFLGELVADLLIGAEEWSVSTLCATPAGVQRLQNKPYPVRHADVSQIDSLLLLENISPQVVFFCASSRGGGEEEYKTLYLQGVQNLLKTWPSAKLFFTSSTSVYAQTEEEVVDENSPVQPGVKGKILLEAEKEVLSAGGTVARFAGIYGPGRSMLMKKFLKGQALLENGGHRWINQIHRDDGARAWLRLMDLPPGIYNVCDDRPARQREIYQWLADFFQRPLPPEGPPDFERKRPWTSKRVANKKLRNLGWTPQWASYKDAIMSLAQTV